MKMKAWHAILLVAAILLPTNAPAQEDFIFDANIIPQGSFLTVRDTTGINQNFIVEIDGHKFPSYQYHDQWIAFIGFDLTMPPGIYWAIVRSKDGHRAFGTTIQVVSRAQPRSPSSPIRINKTFSQKRILQDQEKNRVATSVSSSYLLLDSLNLPIKPWVTTSPFGQNRGQRFHRGIDARVWFGDDTLATIHAIANGKIVINEFQEANGGIVIIDHGGSIFSYYMHLSELTPTPIDSLVTRSQIIGRGGDTGYAAAPHLHFEIHIPGLSYTNKKTSSALIAIDPLEFIEFWNNLK